MKANRRLDTLRPSLTGSHWISQPSFCSSSLMAGSITADDGAPKRKRREGPRAPSRGRGVARYGALLDATDALLQVENPDTIGLYQIAEQAGVLLAPAVGG